MNCKEFLYFSLFSSVISAALNTIQISYGMSYFRHRDSSDIFTYDIARQSVFDKMVSEISLEVREKSGKSQGIFFLIFGGNPESLIIHGPVLRPIPVTINNFINNTGHCRRLYIRFTLLCETPQNTLL